MSETKPSTGILWTSVVIQAACSHDNGDLNIDYIRQACLEHQGSYLLQLALDM